MDVANSRFASQINPCPDCQVPLIGVAGMYNTPVVEAQPHKSGVIRLSDTGGPLPLGLRLTPAMQFGKQGTLHRPHTCRKGRRR